MGEDKELLFDETSLTEEEKKKIDDFIHTIDLKDINYVFQYGIATQKKLADFSDATLRTVRMKSSGDASDLISELISELKHFDVAEEGKGFLGLFKRSGNKMASVQAKYEKAEKNVEQVSDVLEEQQRLLMKDIAMLDKMFDLNQACLRELSMYIIAGQKKLEEVQKTELESARRKAEETKLSDDEQAVRDLEEICDRFEKKLHDLELSRMISLQTAPQIRLLQSSNTALIEKIQSTIVNTIPLWKSQMVVALGISHANDALKTQRKVEDLSGELLSSFNEVLRAQEDGRMKRQAAEADLNRMDQDLKTKLVQVAN